MTVDKGDPPPSAVHKQSSTCIQEIHSNLLFTIVLRRWDNLSLGYTEAPGLPVLREEIAKAYTTVSHEDVVVLAPEEGIFLTLHALLQAGDHIVVTYPGYQALYEVARSVGCQVSYWQPHLDANTHTWVFDMDEFEDLMQPNTKVWCRCICSAEDSFCC